MISGSRKATVQCGLPARVMKLVDIADLKSAGAGLTGSSPVPGTTELSLLVSYLLIRKPRYDVAFVAPASLIFPYRNKRGRLDSPFFPTAFPLASSFPPQARMGAQMGAQVGVPGLRDAQVFPANGDGGGLPMGMAEACNRMGQNGI